MMTYEEMKNKHQKEYDIFAKDKIFYIFTSSKEEFEKKLKEYGLRRYLFYWLWRIYKKER